MPVEHFVDYTNFERTSLVLGSPESKTSKAEGAKNAPFVIAPLYYMYKAANGAVVKAPFCIRICDTRSFGMMPPHDKEYKYKVVLNVDPTAEEVLKCLKVLDAVHERMIELIVEDKQKAAMLKANDLDVAKAKEKGKGFKKLISYPKDKATNEPDYTRNPSVYVDLNKFDSVDKSKSRFETLDLENKSMDIDWKVIEESQYKGRPIIHYTNIYSGNTGISAQSYLVSYAITDLKAKSASNLQTNYLMEQSKSNADSFKSINSSISEMVAKLAASGASNKPNNNDTRHSEPLQSMSSPNGQMDRNGPTQAFSGSIVPNGQMQQYNQQLPQNHMQQYPQVGMQQYPQNQMQQYSQQLPQNQMQLAQNQAQAQVPPNPLYQNQAQLPAVQGQNPQMPPGFNINPTLLNFNKP